MSYRAPIREMRFLLEAFGYEQIASLDAFASYDLETAVSLLEETAQFGISTLLPLNKVGDTEGLKWDPVTGAVTTPTGFRQAYAQLREHGFIGVTGAEEFGGGGAPETVGISMGEIGGSCNKSLGMCPGLSRGLVEALEEHGSPRQKKQFLPNLISGQWSGTMCLTEPQCGTDLGLVHHQGRTRGRPPTGSPAPRSGSPSVSTT
jgi:alkylation response protein AidB-like acyl-CoA dehydrogenase